MRWGLAIAIMATTLAGCAREQSAPSYLGLTDAVAQTDDDSDANDFADNETGGFAPSLRRIPSNKILGAMAFQKVTGKPVDPARLSGSR